MKTAPGIGRSRPAPGPRAASRSAPRRPAIGAAGARAANRSRPCSRRNSRARGARAAAASRSGPDRPSTRSRRYDLEWIDNRRPRLARAIDRRLQPTRDVFAHCLAIEPELAGDRRDRQSLSMKIKNHHDFPSLTTAPLPRFGQAGLGDQFAAIPRARPGDGGTINWGIFKRHFWGELLRHQHQMPWRADADYGLPAAVAPLVGRRIRIDVL